MAFCITFGTQEFTSQLKGYEGVTAQCRNCGNWSAHCITRWPWFTICFIPVIPLSTHKYQEVSCNICHFMQDLKYRPDVQSMQGQQGGQPQYSGQGPYQQSGPPQGWGGGPPGQQGPPQRQQGQGPPQGPPQGYYGQQGGGPQYK